MAALVDHAVAVAVGTGVLALITPDEPWHTWVLVAAGVYVFIKIAVRRIMDNMPAHDASALSYIIPLSFIVGSTSVRLKIE